MTPRNSSLSGSLIQTPTAGQEMHVRFLRPNSTNLSQFFIVLAFSAGPRSCLGERFAITESICILANVVRKYEILIPDELKSKSLEERKKTLLHWIPKLTLTPQNAHVVFRSRY